MQKPTFFSFLMFSPATLIFALMTMFPLGFIIYYSFSDYYFLSLRPTRFIGIDNYQDILNDEYFLMALYNTVTFTLLAVITEIGAGLLLALFLNSIVKFKKTLRTLVLIPTLIPPVTVALIWQIMLANHDGLVNEIFAIFNLDAVNWLNNPKTAFFCILLIDFWQYTPFSFLLIYAALQCVRKDQYEAAAIDGANAFQQFRYITLPAISGSIYLAAILRAIDSFHLFDKINILTGGGPANTTATVTQYIYHFGTQALKIGYGSAASVIMTIIILFIAAFYIRYNFKKQV